MEERVFLRFDEPDTHVLPSDDAGGLADMNADAASTLPEVIPGAVGFEREFIAANRTALKALDATPGASLLTRTVSIQAILRWDIDSQAATGTTGVIICRGIRGSSVERIAYGLELRVVNAAARIGELRMFWEDLAGNRYTAVGGQFQLAGASETMMITAVRRWSSRSDVVVRYYLGDQLLNEVVVTKGDIGGGTTGTTTIGARIDDGAAAWTDFLDGAIDELRILERELVAEEVAATWQRLATLQPAGLQLVLDSLPPGMPVSDDPASRVQREHRLIGHLFGYTGAQAENFRENTIPDRAYGTVLKRWEGITRQSSKPGDDVDTRRRRVLGHLSSHAGISPPGVTAALADLLACGSDQLTLVGYDNTVRDSFDALVAARWRLSPAAPAADWSVAAGELKLLAANGTAADFLLGGWRSALTGVDGPERVGGFGAQLFAKLDPTTIPDGAEAGLVLWDYPRRDALFLGLRNNGGAYQVVSQRYLAGVAQAATVHVVSALQVHWLHLYAVPVAYSGQARDELVAHAVRWSTTSASAGFTAGDPGTFSFSVGWAGFYGRAWNGAALAGDLSVGFDDAAFRFPNGTRPMRFYVLRDPTLPGDYDLLGANSTLKKLRQAHTHAAAVVGPMLAGDGNSGCGFGPCGGI